HRRQRVGQSNLAFGHERTQRLERRLVAGREGAVAARRAVDLGTALDRAPDEIGLEPDDRVATAHRAAFDGFQQEAHGTAAGDLEERRDRRLKVGNQGGPDHLRLAPCITLGKGRCLRLDLHEASRSVSWAQLSSTTFCPLSTCRSARSLMVTPISRSSNWVYWAS